MAVQALQSRDGAAIIAQLAVVIVFDDQAIRLFSPMQQTMADAGGHDRPRRELMGRADVDQADAAGFQGIDVEQAAADGDGHDGIAAVAENLPAQAEARVFDADAGIFIVKQIGQDAEKGNRPGTDDDLRRLCMDAARFIDVTAQGPAQVRDALVIIGSQQPVWFR